jgi:hypothetical protein
MKSGTSPRVSKWKGDWTKCLRPLWMAKYFRQCERDRRRLRGVAASQGRCLHHRDRSDPVGSSRADRILRPVARVAGGYFVRQFAAAGGLLSYGPSITWMYRQAGSYVGQIPQGREPRRHAGHAADPIRIRHQSQDCQGTRPGCPADSARPRRRGD